MNILYLINVIIYMNKLFEIIQRVHVIEEVRVVDYFNYPRLNGAVAEW